MTSRWHKVTRHGLAAGAVGSRQGYNAAVSACEKAARWERGLGLLLEMSAQRVELDEITCNAAISACGAGPSGRGARLGERATRRILEVRRK